MADAPGAEVITRSGRGTDSPQPNDGAVAWSEIERALLAGEGTCWLSVRRQPAGVHTRPLFAAWGGSSFFFATKSEAAKTGHLWVDPDVSLAVHLGGFHLVVEGTAARLTEAADLRRASTAMHEVYDWPTKVDGDQLDAPYAAPTSGGPPFEAWELLPVKAFAFPTEDQAEATRFTFD